MLITVATFSFPHEAHFAKMRLDAEGIPAFIADEHTINMQWLYSNAMGGVRLQVPSACAEDAVRVLNEPDDFDTDAFDAAAASELQADADVDIEPEPERCSHCGGELGMPQQTGRRPAFLTWLLIGLPLWPLRTRRSCRSCGWSVGA
ncbi:DUF2007 domain-containing protein [Aquimonas sp.]|jgi:hypothetical protein|uniref:putative signal transducing protein n=1 Tax=Aquimonas sp. TaxID=1872588 RepID=UPI0037BEBEB1